MTYLNFPEEFNIPFVADEAKYEASSAAADTADATRTVDVVRDEVRKIKVDDMFCLDKDNLQI